jgi:hypothetical protein
MINTGGLSVSGLGGSCSDDTSSPVRREYRLEDESVFWKEVSDVMVRCDDPVSLKLTTLSSCGTGFPDSCSEFEMVLTPF